MTNEGKQFEDEIRDDLVILDTIKKLLLSKDRACSIEVYLSGNRSVKYFVQNNSNLFLAIEHEIHDLKTELGE